MGRSSRRSFLRLGGVVAAAGAVGRADAAPVRTEDFAGAFGLLRRRWREVTAGAPFDPAAEPYRTRLAGLGRAAARYRDTMAPDDRWLWPGLAFPSFNATPDRLRVMARAYVLPGTGLSGDPGLAAAVAAGVDHYRRQVYAEGAEPAGNWWNWEIGVPRRLLDAALLIGPHFGGTPARSLGGAVDHFVPEDRLHRYQGTSTGANRVDLCLVTLLRAVLGADPGKAALAASALSPVFRYVRDGDGLYRDGSFIQHAYVPYQGGYGAVLLAGVATLLAVLRGSPWEITDPERRNVFDSVERSFAPVVHDGCCLDLVRGRGIARASYGDHARGRRIAAAILLLGESAPAADRRRWQGMVKGWAVRDTARPMPAAAAAEGDLALHARLAALLADPAVPAADEPAGHRLLPRAARAVHRRPGWCAGLSMASHRVGHYEHGNGENPRGWHTGSGMLYWWAEGHGDQYSDHFWPTVDPGRLPGTTVSTRRPADGAGGSWGDTCPPARWVGGATDGGYATVGQHLYGFQSTLEAFKSWIFLDDAVVCLGAGITAGDGVPVETVVDNRRTAAPLSVAFDRKWAHISGHGGYVVLGGGPLRVRRDRRTGRGATRSYATLWLDHGVDPWNAGYVYLLLPGASRAGTRARAADPGWVRVLANTAARQGVHLPSLGITAVNFWRPGTAGGLTASGSCAVLVREHGDGTATLTVADPREDLEELTLTWDRPVRAVLHAHPAAVVVTTGATPVITYRNLSARAGASHPITLALGPPP
ncbi:lyase [Sphaerisporangium rufum]|uniref:Lyase n=1 Tax=Sphaerisporangium rufum TaxID=1381558 RepID=A0A919RD93_9ACTN|nr:polysaccharide lyase 8 family protein [Sphaerisporangium rufum]GII81860.1 lyase [Sphaerisporangium rufum]